jgi:radical SAM protein with 4Fe4S-binding SPASM domain
LLVISFGASTKEVYEKIWRGLNYQKVTKNIINAWQERKKTHIQIRTIVTEENKHQIRDINKEWSQYCDVWTPTEEFHLPGYNRKKWKKTPKRNCKDRKRLTRECVVKSNGDVVLCCNDLDGDYVIGNVKETPILEVWNSPEFEECRKRIYKKNDPPPICEECVIRPW